MTQMTIPPRRLTTFLLAASVAAILVHNGSVSADSPITTDGALQLQLKYVALIFRHGPRSPISLFPTYSNASFFWPDGLGQLTARGVRREYSLGKLMRQRYVKSNFLSARYNHNELFVYTTGYERTFLSASSYLAGLYCDENEQCIAPAATPQPNVQQRTVEDIRDNEVSLSTIRLTSSVVPMHVFTNISDKKVCPHYKYLLSLPNNNSKPGNVSDQRTAVLAVVANRTGFGSSLMQNLGDFTDALECIREHGYPLPVWITDEIINELLPNSSGCSPPSYNSVDLELIRFDVGLVFNDVIGRFEAAIASPSRFADLNQRNTPVITVRNPEADSGLRMTVYSGHDTQVGGALRAFRSCAKPELSSGVIIELHRILNYDSVSASVSQLSHPQASSSWSASAENPETDAEADKFVVRVLYVHTVNGTHVADALELAECKWPCTFREFRRVIETYSMRDIDEACENKASSGSDVFSQYFVVPNGYIKFLYAAFAVILFAGGIATGVVSMVVGASRWVCIRSCFVRNASSERGNAYRLVSAGEFESEGRQFVNDEIVH